MHLSSGIRYAIYKGEPRTVQIVQKELGSNARIRQDEIEKKEQKS